MITRIGASSTVDAAARQDVANGGRPASGPPTVATVLEIWISRPHTAALLGPAGLQRIDPYLVSLRRRFGAIEVTELTPERVLSAYRRDPADDYADLGGGAERSILTMALDLALEYRLLDASPLRPAIENIGATWFCAHA